MRSRPLWYPWPVEIRKELEKYFIEVSRTQAVNLFRSNKKVFGIDWDGHEGLIENIKDMGRWKKYGIEKEVAP